MRHYFAFNMNVLLSAVVVLLLVLPTAAQTPSTVDTLKVLDSEGYPGNDISINIGLVNTFRVSAFSGRVVFDESSFHLISLQVLPRAAMLEWSGVDTTHAGVVRFYAVGPQPIEDWIPPGSGNVMELQFHVSEGAVPGIYPMALEDSGFGTYENQLSDSLGQLIIPVLAGGQVEIWNPTGINDNPDVPDNYLLLSNFPNPFNGHTAISFTIPQTGQVKIKIFDLNGGAVKQIHLGNLPSGHYLVDWNGRNETGKEVTSGVYCYALYFDQMSVVTKKMVLIK